MTSLYEKLTNHPLEVGDYIQFRAVNIRSGIVSVWRKVKALHADRLFYVRFDGNPQYIVWWHQILAIHRSNEPRPVKTKRPKEDKLPPITYACANCGSTNVKVSSWCRWQPVQQRWLLAATFTDACYCEACDTARAILMVPFKPEGD